MLFQKKIDRVIDEEKSAEKFRETLEKTPLEKGDLSAMIIAGLAVLLPVIILVGVGLMLLVACFFWR